MAAVEVLISVHGSHKRWTSGYEGIDNLALRRLLVEINFAARSIEFELSAREIEPSTGSTTNGTSEGTLVKPSYLKSQRAKETIIRRGNELRGIYEKFQNTANKIKKNGLSDFAVVPGSQRAQLFVTILHDVMENAVIPSHDNWSSNTHISLNANFESLASMQLRKLSSTWYKTEARYFARPLESNFATFRLILIDVKKSEKEPTPISDKEQRGFFSSYTQAESHETTMVEDDNGLEENNHLGLTCSQESNNIHQAFESQKGMVVAATCDATSTMLQPNALQVGNDNYQLHRLHDQSHLNPSSVYISESTRSPPFAFPCGILIEDTFNRNSTLIFERPYESAIFAVVQDGDIPALMALLRSGNASIHDVDPYGLGLLYYASYYCWKAHGPDRAM
ncbi:uncharacterized protein N7518_010165 [Penicillium psychrosexuale]|uniref:uncharacterized protein n=1 Tax=Penicillium psychrosexuale TaxID=1002107 RepID=UPI0025456BEE|nr:uncharacterized protein N7518_010165 [Penicillium psychrosexuale]KAJ5781682.1 hypothetical protein N7518_010165 [Penicillium psychrosexuale]